MARRLSNARAAIVFRRMASRIFLSFLVALLCGWMATGCRSAQHPPSQSARAATKPGTVRAQAVPVEPEIPLEKRAAAHAHYGSGVIHMMNREPDAAFKEFRLALTEDPSAEDMALDLSKKY